MPCQYLSCYTPADTTWSVATCSGKGAPYIPSTLELTRYCQTVSHRQCPVIFQSLPLDDDICSWPELEVAALAQCHKS